MSDESQTLSGRQRRRRLLKGKTPIRSTELPSRRDGAGSNPGVLLNMSLAGDGIVSSVYTIPIQVGSDGKTYPMQIDTGSSDSWIASPSCSSSACSSYKGPKYDASKSSSSASSHDTFGIEYLRGVVSGPVYTDVFHIGGSSLANQSFSAVDNVVDEPLRFGFSGLLGFALPQNSKIAQQESSSNASSSILAKFFDSTVNVNAPSEHFVSILLARPGLSRVPSLLGLGAHPESVLPSVFVPPPNTPSNITWESQLSQAKFVVSQYFNGYLYWAAPVTAITVYSSGQPTSIDLGGVSHTNPSNTAQMGVLDTGIPFIFVRRDVAESIYKIYGTGAAPDGQYYVPCTTPMNVSISINNQEYPIHPFDLTYVSSGVKDPNYCIGAIQGYGGDLSFGDIILGAAFLRNVYTMLSLDRRGSTSSVFTNGSIPVDTSVISVLGVTNITTALDEFHTVRVLHQTLQDGTGVTPATSSDALTSNSSKNGVPIGAIVGGILGFLALCGAIIVARMIYHRRQLEKELERGRATDDAAYYARQLRRQNGAGVYELDVKRGHAKTSSVSTTTSSTVKRVGGRGGGGLTPSSSSAIEVGSRSDLLGEEIDGEGAKHELGSPSYGSGVHRDPSLLDMGIPMFDSVTAHSLRGNRTFPNIR